MLSKLFKTTILSMALYGSISVAKTLATTDQQVFKLVSAHAALSPSEALTQQLDNEYCFAVIENRDRGDAETMAAVKSCLDQGFKIDGDYTITPTGVAK